MFLHESHSVTYSHSVVLCMSREWRFEPGRWRQILLEERDKRNQTGPLRSSCALGFLIRIISRQLSSLKVVLHVSNLMVALTASTGMEGLKRFSLLQDAASMHKECSLQCIIIFRYKIPLEIRGKISAIIIPSAFFPTTFVVRLRSVVKMLRYNKDLLKNV